MGPLGALAGGGLVSILLVAGLGAAAGWLALGGRRGAITGGAFGALLVTVALLPSQIFRTQLVESAIALFWLTLFVTPIVLYAMVLRRLRRRADPTPEPVQQDPGLRLIEADEALHAERLAALKAINDAQPGFWRDRFSIAWREADGTVLGSVRVTITMGLAEISALHVDETARGRGLGRALLEGAEDEARRRGASRARLHTFSWQVPGFYARLGWQERGRIALDAGAERIEFEKAL